MSIAELLTLVALGYVLAGVVVAVLMHVRGLARLDPTTAGAGWGFRVVLTPGLIGLWPWVLMKWSRSTSTDREGGARARGAHGGGGHGEVGS